MQFFKVIKILFKSKWIFKKPSEKKIIIFDKTGSEIIKKYLPVNSYHLLPSRFEIVNFYCLAKTIFNRKILTKKFSKSYIVNFIKISNASIIISFTDHNTVLWDLKKNLPKVKVLLIQNGFRVFEENKNLVKSVNGQFISSANKGFMQKTNQSHKIDLVFTANEYFSRKYKELFKCKTKVIGYFRNNHLIYKSKVTKKKYDLTYISQYRTYIKNKYNEILPDEPIIKYLNEYAQKNNKRLNILAGPERKLSEYSDNYELQNFCDKELKYKNWSIDKSINKNRHHNYFAGMNSDVIVTIDSTLGYELMTRGKRVAFFSIRDWAGIKNTFGYPKKIENNGTFWTNKNNTKKFKKILDYLFSCSDKVFYTKNKKIINDLIFLDKNNQIFKKTIKRIINEK